MNSYHSCTTSHRSTIVVSPRPHASPCTPSLLYNTANTDIYTLSLHDALPIYGADTSGANRFLPPQKPKAWTDVRPTLWWRSEEHTSELQSRRDLVCRLLLEKKKGVGE